jgi:hypothetical protein
MTEIQVSQVYVIPAVKRLMESLRARWTLMGTLNHQLGHLARRALSPHIPPCTMTRLVVISMSTSHIAPVEHFRIPITFSRMHEEHRPVSSPIILLFSYPEMVKARPYKLLHILPGIGHVIMLLVLQKSTSFRIAKGTSCAYQHIRLKQDDFGIRNRRRICLPQSDALEIMTQVVYPFSIK